MRRFKEVASGILFCLLITTAGCSPAVAEPSTDTQSMDFQKQLELKKPQQVKKEPNILFLGNSFTYVNDLPSVFTQLSVSGGFNPVVDELSDAGYHLEFFADETDDLGKLAYYALENYQWDYVVLQEQSRLPTVAAEEMMYPAARTLDQMVRKAGGESVFFMTWSYKEGDEFEALGKTYKTTREQMQSQLAESYMTIANELDAYLAPVGIAFMRSAEQYPEIELWDEDKNHASPAGTYLAANVFYATLYNQSPEGLSYTADLKPEIAAKLQQMAAQTVLGK